MPTYSLICRKSTCSNVVGTLVAADGDPVPTAEDLKGGAACVTCAADYQAWRAANPTLDSSVFYGDLIPASVLFSPTSGPIGTVVTVKAIHVLCTVSFNGHAADTPIAAGDGVTVIVPAGATTGHLSVDLNSTGPNGPVPPVDFGVFTVT